MVIGHKSKTRSQTLKGNKSGTKLKIPEIRQEAYKQYCKHIAEGYPKHSFFFKHPDHYVCWATMERYINENPDEFDPSLLIDAKAKRYKYWFGEGKTLMKGGYKGGSPTAWQTIMRNMFKEYGWDQSQPQENHRTHVEKLQEGLDAETLPQTEEGH